MSTTKGPPTGGPEPLSDEAYAVAVELLYLGGGIRERMKAVLMRWQQAARDAGYESDGPHDLSDDCYRWYIVIEGNGLPEPVDVSIEIAESLEYEGGTEGVNFSIDIVAVGGEIIGGLTPHNYTPQVWVPITDREAVLARFAILEQAVESAGIELIDEWKERRPS